MENKELDKFFSDVFKNAEETPSANIWNKIERNLDQQTKIAPLRKKINWWLYSSAAIALFTLGYFGVISHNNQVTTAVLKEENNVVSSIDHDNMNRIKQENSISSNIYDRQIIPVVKEKKIVQKVEIPKPTQTYTSKQNIAKIDPIPEYQLTLTITEPNKNLVEPTIYRQVTEIDDIKPLIEFEEESETMLATTNPSTHENKSFITTVLNKISENLDKKNEKELRFIADEEGSFSINIINSIAKNPNKKRK